LYGHKYVEGKKCWNVSGWKSKWINAVHLGLLAPFQQNVVKLSLQIYPVSHALSTLSSDIFNFFLASSSSSAWLEHFYCCSKCQKISQKSSCMSYIAVLTFWCSADAVDHMHIVGQLSQKWLWVMYSE
jgi:hypothetical protein